MDIFTLAEYEEFKKKIYQSYVSTAMPVDFGVTVSQPMIPPKKITAPEPDQDGPPAPRRIHV